jgi:hypothetical protein
MSIYAYTLPVDAVPPVFALAGAELDPHPMGPISLVLGAGLLARLCGAAVSQMLGRAWLRAFLDFAGAPDSSRA